MKWAGYVECKEEGRDAYVILVGDLREGNHLEDPGEWKDNINLDPSRNGGGGHGMDRSG